MKYIDQPEKYHDGERFRARQVIAHEDLLARLVQVPNALVYSSWRSKEEQRKLYEDGKSKTMNSNHRRGTAIDVWNWEEVQEELRAVGLINDISWDRNHFALGGEREASKYPLVNEVNNLEKYMSGRKTDSKLRKIIEKITGEDYGKMDTEKLQEEAAEDLEKMLKKTEKEMGDKDQKIKDLEEAIKNTNPITPEQIKDLKEFEELKKNINSILKYKV